MLLSALVHAAAARADTKSGALDVGVATTLDASTASAVSVEDAGVPPVTEAGSAAAVVPIAPAVPAAHLSPEALALCRSADPNARSYCLGLLESAPVLDADAQRALIALTAEQGEIGTRARALYEQRYGWPVPVLEQGPGVEPSPREATPEETASVLDPTRVIFAPTGFGLRQGDRYLQAHELGFFDLRFSPESNLEIGLRTVLPVGVVAGSALVRYARPFRHGAFAVYGEVGGAQVFIASDRGGLIAGGGAALSVGTPDTSLTLGALAYYANFGYRARSVIAPYAGISHRVSARVRLNAEGYVLMLKRADQELDGPLLGVFSWGIRIGQRIWGDIAFIDPICDGCDSLYEVMPLGLPYVSFGMLF